MDKLYTFVKQLSFWLKAVWSLSKTRKNYLTCTANYERKMYKNSVLSGVTM